LNRLVESVKEKCPVCAGTAYTRNWKGPAVGQLESITHCDRCGFHNERTWGCNEMGVPWATPVSWAWGTHSFDFVTRTIAEWRCEWLRENDEEP
jgi:hypothetical protein